MRMRWLLGLIAGLTLAGCASMSGFPRPIIDERQEDAELAPYVGPEAIARYEACTDKVACRNVFIDARLHAVDLAFYRFQRKLYGQKAQVSLGGNVLAMALDSAAAITATRPLAAGAGLLSGGRDAYEKQVLSASLPLLFGEIVASRREVLLRIRLGEQLPVERYSLFQALADVGDYEMAGSIPAAAAELATSAGASSRNAQARLDALHAQVVAAPVMAAVSLPVAVPVPVAGPPATAAPPVAQRTGAAYDPAVSSSAPAQPILMTQPSPPPAPKTTP